MGSMNRVVQGGRLHAIWVVALFWLVTSPSVRAQSDANAKLSAPEGQIANRDNTGAALEKLLKAIHADGPVKLSETVQADVFALLPSARRGEECPSPASVSPEAIGLRDRGDGSILVAQLTNCQGPFVMAYSPGIVPKASRLFDLSEGESLVNAHALNLRGTKRDDDLAIVVHVGLVREELRFFLHRDGFTFAPGGVLKDFGERGDCSAGGDVTGGFASFIRVDAAGRLVVLRVDAACGGGAWQAKCELWSVENGVTQAGICSLPGKLDAKSLRSSGWR